MINWQEQHLTTAGIAIKSPVTGDIMPLSAHSDPLYHSNVLSYALCIKPKSDTLLAPFHCSYSSCLYFSRRLIFKHKTGLTLQVDLPDVLQHGQNKSARTLSQPGSNVATGQPILRLAPQVLQNSSTDLLTLMIVPNPAIAEVFSIERFVEAGRDTVFTIQLKNKKL